MVSAQPGASTVIAAAQKHALQEQPEPSRHQKTVQNALPENHHPKNQVQELADHATKVILHQSQALQIASYVIVKMACMRTRQNPQNAKLVLLVIRLQALMSVWRLRLIQVFQYLKT